LTSANNRISRQGTSIVYTGVFQMTASAPLMAAMADSSHAAS
jgi:hypothetical protein